MSITLLFKIITACIRVLHLHLAQKRKVTGLRPPVTLYRLSGYRMENGDEVMDVKKLLILDYSGFINELTAICIEIKVKYLTSLPSCHDLE